MGRFIEAARWKGAWNGMFALADKTQNVIGMIGFRAAPLSAPVAADLVCDTSKAVGAGPNERGSKCLLCLFIPALSA